MAERHLDLIDRQALLAKKTEMELCFAVSEYDIANAPRVDAVEVVRCKECKHFLQEEHGCNHFGYYSHTPWVDEVDFCSYGERINDG